jgi:hypothetical protein
VTDQYSGAIDVSADSWEYDQGLADLRPVDSVPTTDGDVLGATTSLADLIQGTPDDDILLGGPGDDTVQGFGGNDLIAAGAGDDFVIADSGGRVDAGAGDDYVYVAGGGATTVALGAGADSLEFVAYGEHAVFGVHRILDYDVFEDGPLNIAAYLNAEDAGNIPNLDSNGDGVIDGADNGVAIVDGSMIIDLSIAWYHDLGIGTSVIALDGITSLPVDLVG